MTPEERRRELEETLRKSAETQDEAADVLREIAARLDALSEEMRRHSAFPFAGQLKSSPAALGPAGHHERR